MTIPYRVSEQLTPVAAAREAMASLEDGTGDRSTELTVAGRVVLKRDSKNYLFLTLQDGTGRMQVFADKNATDGHSDAAALDPLTVGDWITATGHPEKTKRGEPSLAVHAATVLASPLHPWPDKWHGVSDPDTRFRQRELDLWATPEANEVLRNRSRIMSLTRRWMEDQGFIEVETPVFHPIPGGALARPFITHHNALDAELYLRIAPELYLKRLVVGGFERVFEIARVFRNEGLSTRHNPEFTMLEAYWAYSDYGDAMELTENLVAHLAQEICGTTVLQYGPEGEERELDLTPPWRRATLADLIEEQIGVRIDVRTPVDELRALAHEHGVHIEDSYGPGKLMLEIYEKTTEAALWGPVFVMDYPKEVSPLARDHREVPGMAERFEAIVAGRELCNAFSELSDPVEQRLRFEEQVRQRDAGDAEAMVVDEEYIRALEYGLPPTAGLGVGMDRLVMLLTNTTSIRDVILFPTLRPQAPAREADQQEEGEDL
jgi:lysyl-tRNA synthetase class 2